MPHIAKFREGWTNENLAQFLLYKFSFTANPSKIADDIGIDFFCTLFTKRKEKSTTYLLPRNSFAIQIKSNRDLIDISNNLDLYINLELPFLVGVVNQKELKISIYSGEFFQPFFSFKGTDLKLKINLTERLDSYTIENYFEEVDNNDFLIDFPFLMEISARDEDKEIENKSLLLQETCSCIFDNISAKRNNEFIFKIRNNNSYQPFMFAGPGSVKSFRNNVINRITEAFYNVDMLSNINLEYIDLKEFEMYKEFYLKAKEIYGSDNLPKFLLDSYNNLNMKMKKNRIVTLTKLQGILFIFKNHIYY